MSNRAQVFADASAEHAGDNILHIYVDGFVVAVACSVEHHRIVGEWLREEYRTVEEGRSRDGFLSVFVLPGVRPHLNPAESGSLVLLTDFYNDHRAEDINTIDGAARLLRAAGA